MLLLTLSCLKKKETLFHFPKRLTLYRDWDYLDYALGSHFLWIHRLCLFPYILQLEML